MKFVPVLLSALFLATIWLCASASTSRHPRQLRVPLPLPTPPSPLADRRKSALFPRMGATFVVTERAHKMAAPIKMVPMKRTNALLPNLSLKQRIMGGTTKRMTDPGPIPGIAARPVVIRPFNLTKPTLAIASTARTPLVITRRPLVRIPTHVDAGATVTVGTPSLSTRRPITRPLLHSNADSNITSESPVVTRRPIHGLPNRADSVTRLTEQVPVITTKRLSVRPHFHSDSIKLPMTRSPVVRTTIHVEAEVTEETPLVVPNNLESGGKMAEEKQAKTTKRPPIRPHFLADAAGNKLTVTISPIARTTNHLETDRVTDETRYTIPNHVDSDSKITEETNIMTTKPSTIKPHFHVDADKKLTVTRSPIVRTINYIETDKATEETPFVLPSHVDSDSKMAEETMAKTTKRPTVNPNFNVDAGTKLNVTRSSIVSTTDHVDTNIKFTDKTTTTSHIEEITTFITKRPTFRTHTRLFDSKDSKISTGEKVSLPSPTKRPLLKSPALLIYNKDDGKIVMTEATLVSTSQQSIEGDDSKGTIKSAIEGTPVVDTMSFLTQRSTRSEGAEDISEGTPLVRVKRLQANAFLDSRIKKGVSTSDTGMPGGLSDRDRWWWW